MTEHRRGIPPTSPRVWDLERTQRVHEKGHSARESGTLSGELSARRVGRKMLKASAIVPGMYLRVDGRWYRVEAQAASPYGTRWLVSDITSPDSPRSIVPWSEVQFVASAD